MTCSLPCRRGRSAQPWSPATCWHIAGSLPRYGGSASLLQCMNRFSFFKAAFLRQFLPEACETYGLRGAAEAEVTLTFEVMTMKKRNPSKETKPKEFWT